MKLIALISFSNSYNSTQYLDAIKNHTKLLEHNVQLWSSCLQQSTCTDSTFLQQACGRFPTVLVTTVRLRLALTEWLFNDPLYEKLRVIYVVRDPRAIMHSRMEMAGWCNGTKDCIDPSQLCKDIIADLDAFEMLVFLHPGRLAFYKYETLASEPQKTFEEIFKFSQLPFLAAVNQTINQHTTQYRNVTWDTRRLLATRIEEWKKKLPREEIDRIQNVCSNAINRLGYSLM